LSATRDAKAFSTIIWILLIVCATIIGGLISYIWVIADYYNVPENTTFLMVDDVHFPYDNFTYFQINVLNPSNSADDMNITAFRLNVESINQTFFLEMTEPPLENFTLKRGTRQTFKVFKDWSAFAGEAVRIEPIPLTDAATTSFPFITPKAELRLIPDFDASQTVEYFNLTVGSIESLMNLTISEIDVYGTAVNVTPSLSPPLVLLPNETKVFRCERNWENLREQNVTITVKTLEGYQAVYETNRLQGAILNVDNVKFDYADTSYFNLTVSNSEDSTANAYLSGVNLTLHDNTTITLDTLPPLHAINIPVTPNNSTIIKCFWDWNALRNETIVVNVYTRQGFKVGNKTVATPLTTVWNITDVKFDLDDPGHFSVNVTNMPCSLNSINITKILLNNQNTTLDPPSAVVANGTQAFTCAIDWTNLIGQTVNITAFTEDSMTNSTTRTIPSVQLKLIGDNPVYGDLTDPSNNITIPYINITISNSMHSLGNVTTKRITLETENGTREIDGALTYPRLLPNGYFLITGENVTIVCPWDYTLYLHAKLTVTVYTAEGFQASKTWQLYP